jgi:hypothetical protein
MGENRVFFPQEALDEWLEQGRVQLVGDELTTTPEGRRLRVESALRFVAEVGAGADPHGLIGKVKTLDQVEALTGEHCADSVIIGDCAYQVVEGWLGELLPTIRRTARRKPDADASPQSDELAVMLRGG